MKKKEIDLNRLSAEEIGRLFPIRVVPCDPGWKTLFETEKALIINTLGPDAVIGIEHIGSTSVEGLAAKPTVDILVEVSDLSGEVKRDITRKLETIGYDNMHNAEKENKMTLGKGYDVNTPDAQTYHLHIREKGDALPNEIYFRDCLRQHADVREEYAKLKVALAEKYRFNREAYTQAKTEFITRMTERQKRETT